MMGTQEDPTDCGFRLIHHWMRMRSQADGMACMAKEGGCTRSGMGAEGLA